MLAADCDGAVAAALLGVPVLGAAESDASKKRKAEAIEDDETDKSGS